MSDTHDDAVVGEINDANAKRARWSFYLPPSPGVEDA